MEWLEQGLLGNVEPDSFGPVPAFKWRRRGYVRMFVTRNRHHADKRDAGPLWQLHIFAGESGRMVSLVFKLFVQCVTYAKLRLPSFGRNPCYRQRMHIPRYFAFCKRKSKIEQTEFKL